MRKLNHIQIHHSATANDLFTGKNHEKIWKSFRRFHLRKGWFDIGYHFGIFPDGKILPGRSIKYKPAGIAFHNCGGIAICLVGIFDKVQPTQKQCDRIIKLVADIMDKYDIKTIVFHRDFSKKSCPGWAIDKNNFIEEVSKCRQKNI